MKLIAQCLFSPQLYKIYRQGAQSDLYEPRGIERWGNRVISMANMLLNISLYTSPFICMYIYKRGFFSYDEARQIGRLFSCIGCVLAVSFTMRGYGRATNPNYVKFLQALTYPMTDKKVYLSGIRQYDFEFNAWPATFTVSPRRNPGWFEQHPFSKTANPDLPLYQRVTIQVLAFVATHTFGLRLIYPGSMAIIQSILWGSLFQGRTHLVEDYDGQRTKLRTADGNEIDTMFVDNRNKSPKGKYLIICCEGNSGFYEFGIMTTPTKAEYSALGWNHPGFAESTGLPYPSQEHSAIEAVMLYAINELGFKPEQIVTFGWSIGGYSAAWAAVNFPVRGLILDATFDDLLPLAENHMPSSWSLLVKEVVRSYVDLNVAALVTQYNGPVQLIRRSEDEVICLRQGVIATNRGNFLLMKIIEHRRPDVLTKPLARATLIKILSMQQRYWSTKPEFSTVSVVSDYLRDVKSTHCAPLPEDTFVDIMSTITETSR